MKKYILLAFVASSTHSYAQSTEKEIEIETINIYGKRIERVSQSEVKSADLAETLSKNNPSVSLIRRSGISNDLLLRGQTRDNINILIDDTKIHGACPNRMDPPTSHVVNNQIEAIEIFEGPYDVANAGGLTGTIKIETLKPSSDLGGALEVTAGSNSYQKYLISAHGGNELVQVGLVYSHEESKSYIDGNGDDIFDQIKSYNPMIKYHEEFLDNKIYEKKSWNIKVNSDLNENQSLLFSYTNNESDDVFYPSSPMDALSDDSALVKAEYRAKNLASFVKELKLDLYQNNVKHPMSTKFRVSSDSGSVNEVISRLETESQGAKITNRILDTGIWKLDLGLDHSKRTWDGNYEGYGNKAMISGKPNIDNAESSNIGFFTKANWIFSEHEIETGLRIDQSKVSSDAQVDDQSFDSFGGFLLYKNQIVINHKVFLGVGLAHRIPDPRELFFQNSKGVSIGNRNLEQTKNSEYSLGIESEYEGFDSKIKIFYSDLTDYIYYNSSKKLENFENIDAKIWGASLNGNWSLESRSSLNWGIAAQKGLKNKPLVGQTSKNLANMVPVKGYLGVTQKVGIDHSVSLNYLAADVWKNYDSENGEQKLAGWAVLNLKTEHRFMEKLKIIFGVDNLLNRTYAVNNTYKDLTLVENGEGDVILLNEPGRYFYGNIQYQF